MLNFDKLKDEFPALYKFFKLNLDEHFSSVTGGYKIDFDFKEELSNDIEKMFNKYDEFTFKLKKYELEKIPMLVASNQVFKDRCKENNAKLEKNIEEKNKYKTIAKKMAEYINTCDHETIWCKKSKCDQKCYECILEDFLEKYK